MADWRTVFSRLGYEAEETFERLSSKLIGRLGGADPLTIDGYRTYGTAQRVLVKARVLEQRSIKDPTDKDTIWRNVLGMYQRFESDEVPGARVRVRVGGTERELTADSEGYVEAWIDLERPLPSEQLWHPVELELLDPAPKGSHCRCLSHVMVPPASAQFLVISDIDDTVVKTDATSMLRMARTVFLGNARTRLPFSGVSAFYRELHAPEGHALNPLFYVSSSPWNLYDLLIDFMGINDIPLGPLMLRDWGASRSFLSSNRHHDHKGAAIRNILDLIPLPCILIGDSGQHDPEIYSSVVADYPERILGIYIRNITRTPERLEKVRALAEQVAAAKSTLILADDTHAAAVHAHANGWIDQAALEEVARAVKADEAVSREVEELLADEEEARTVIIAGGTTAETVEAIEAGAIESAAIDAKSEGEQAPTIIVEGDPHDPDAGGAVAGGGGTQ